MPPSRSLTIQGWRFLGHSYAHVNQSQLLELLTRPGITLFHIDAPLCNPAWRHTRGLFAAAQEAALEAIPAPTAPADALLRLQFPYDVSPSDAKRTLAFATVENTIVPPFYMAEGRPIGEAMKNSATTIVTPSRWAMQGLMRSGVKSKHIALLPHGVDPTIFTPATPERRAELRTRFGWDDKFVVLNIGAMTRNKGIDLLLRAVASLADDHPSVILVLKGFDAMFNSQAEFLQAGEHAGGALAKLGERVQYFGGQVTQPQMAEFYQAADAYVCPYRAEGFNLPALEAAACGLPIVTTAGGPTDDFVTGDFALKVPATLVQSPTTVGGQEWKPNLEVLAAHLRRVIKDSTFRDAARQAGPAHVHASYTWAKAVDTLLTLI